MTEFELIKKIRELKAIRPNQNWVSLTKSQILGEEPKRSLAPLSVIRILFSWKPAYAGLVFAFVLVGIFGFSQNSLPGDPLYLIKKITEKCLAVFISENEKPNFQLKLTNARLNELAQIAQSNETGKLSPALKELAAAKTEVQKEVVNSVKGKSTEEAMKIAKEFVLGLEAFNKKEKEVLGSLGLGEIGESPEKALVEFFLNDLKTASLTEEQTNLFSQAKADYENGEYWSALEKILLLTNQ